MVSINADNKNKKNTKQDSPSKLTPDAWLSLSPQGYFLRKASKSENIRFGSVQEKVILKLGKMVRETLFITIAIDVKTIITGKRDMAQFQIKQT